MTRAGLRNKIRDKLNDWWINQDSLNHGGTLNATDTSFTASDGSKFHEGDLIEIDTEVMKVTGVSTNTITVIRGYKGSTAATHADTTAIYIVNEWTSVEYNDAITEAFNRLHPYIFNEFVGDIRGYNNKWVLDDCDTADWTEGGDASAETLNTTDYKEGTACLNLGATYSTGSATYTKTVTSMNATNYEYLNLWIYIEAKTDSSDDYYYDQNQFCIVRLGNDASNYGSISVRLDEMNDTGWTLLNLPITEFTTTGTWDKTATDYVYIDFKVLKNITVGDLRMDEWKLTKYPITTNKLAYKLPENVFRVNEVRLYDDEDSNNFYKDLRWDIQGDYLVFRTEVGEAQWSTGVRTASRKQRSVFAFPDNKPMQIFGDKALAVPTADTDTIDLDDREEETVILGATVYMFERMIAERSRFTQYSAKLNKEDMSVLDVIRGMNSFRDRYLELIDQFEDPGKPVEMEFGR